MSDQDEDPMPNESNPTLIERERCAAIVQAAREGEIDSDLRSILYRINNP